MEGGILMNLELPSKYKDSSCFIKKDTLHLLTPCNFERLMYSLTYELNPDLKCTFCNTTLRKTTATLDHSFPRATGGISITNNLRISCSSHNSQKGNMTVEQYETYKTLTTEKERRRFKVKVNNDRITCLQSRGFILPEEWVTLVKISSIYYNPSQYIPIRKKYAQAFNQFKKYGTLPKPIILDRNHNLLSSPYILLLAKELNLTALYAIILENVVLF